MNDVILTSEDGGYRVVASNEREVEDPRWGAEVGTMICNHPQYALGDEQVGVARDFLHALYEYGAGFALNFLRVEHGVTVVLPLYLHDHSGLSMTAGANLLNGGGFDVTGWDTTAVGFMFATAANLEGAGILGDAETILRAEVAEYDLYLRGEVYTLEVQQRVVDKTHVVRTRPGGVVEEIDLDRIAWERVPDSAVARMYGTDGMTEVAAEVLAEAIP